MNRALLLALLLAPALAHAGETMTIPAGVFVLDESYLQSTLNKRWDGNHQAPRPFVTCRGRIRGCELV